MVSYSYLTYSTAPPCSLLFLPSFLTMVFTEKNCLQVISSIVVVFKTLLTSVFTQLLTQAC